MARPRKKGLDYFPLDVNLDYKWEAIKACHDHVGFSFCIQLMQECYKTPSGEINCSEVIRRRTLEKQTNISRETFEEVMNTATEVGLFDKTAWNEDKIITSNGIKSRIDMVSKERKSARVRSEKSSSPEKPPKNTRKTPEEVHKVKESKGKKRRNIIPPKVEWVKEYCDERKNGIEPQQFMDSNEANGWMRGKSKMKDWEATIRTWENHRKNNGYEQTSMINKLAPKPMKKYVIPVLGDE